MKLIDLLVKELPKRGGWPDGVVAMAQDANGAVQNYRDTDDIRIDSQHAFGTSRIIGSYSIAEDEVSAATDRLTSIITRAQYESALSKNDGWIEWGGGECPVKSDSIVYVRFRGGFEDKASAHQWHWKHDYSHSDIIAYRLHNPDINTRANDDRLEQDLNECIGQGVDMPEWNGDGLPPVGEKVEFFINPKLGYRNPWIPDAGTEMEVVAHKTTTDGNNVAVCYWDERGAGRSCCFVPETLKPLRTEAERAREDAETAIRTCLVGTGAGITPLAAKGIYEAIAAGKIPGVKLDGK